MSRVLPARAITLTSAASFSSGCGSGQRLASSDALFDALDQNHDGVITRSEFSAGLGSSISIGAHQTPSTYRRPEASLLGSLPSRSTSATNSYVPQPRGSSVSLSSGLSQGSTVPALVEARVLTTSAMGSNTPRPVSRQMSSQNLARGVRTASPALPLSVTHGEPQVQARPPSPVRAAPLAAEPQASAGCGRTLTREEMMRTGRLMKSPPVEMQAAEPSVRTPMAAPPGRPVEPGKPEGPDVGQRRGQLPLAAAQQVEPLVQPAEPAQKPRAPPSWVALPVKPKGEAAQATVAHAEPVSLSQSFAAPTLSPRAASTASTTAALQLSTVRLREELEEAKFAASNELESLRTSLHGESLTQARLREELDGTRGMLDSEASAAAQLRLQLRTAEAAARAATLQAESATLKAGPSVSQEELDQLTAEVKESRNLTSQLKVELSCVTSVRDNVQLDLHEEVTAAGALRQQLQAAEATVWDLGQTNGVEVKDLRHRNAELEAEASRHLRVCDRIYEDLSTQTELNSQLKHELAVAQELAKANLELPPSSEFDDGEKNRQQMRIMELEAERMQQQSRMIELEALATSAEARQRELEDALEQERARTAQLQRLLDEKAVLQQQLSDEVAVQQQLAREAAASAERRVEANVTAAAAAAAVASSSSAKPGNERQERLLKSLEAEQAKVTKLREALVAAEERAQRAELAQKEAENAAATAQAGLGSPSKAGPDVASVNLRDLAWENASVVGAGEPEQPAVERQLSDRSKDRLFEAVQSDDMDTLKLILQSESGEDAVMAVLRARDGMGRTLLQVALANGASEAAKFFLGEGQRWAQRRKFMFQLQGELLERELGGFVNGQDHYGQNALAVLCGASTTNREVFCMLMENQADPTQRDLEGKTPFMQSAKSGNVQIMGALIRASRGVVLTDVDDNNRSALHWASLEGRNEAVELLLKAGADADAADLDGKTPADLARAAGHMEVTQALAEVMSDEALDNFMGQDRPRPRGSSEGDEDDDDDEEDFEIPAEDSVPAHLPRFEDSDSGEFATGLGGRGPGRGWTSL